MNKKKFLLLIMFLAWLWFIFFDWYINKNKEAENIIYMKNIGINTNDIQKQKTNQEIEISKQIFEKENIEKQIEKKFQTNWDINKNLNTLLEIYEKEPKVEILKEIIIKQAQNYNFNEARNNIKKLVDENETIDINLIFYVYLNSNNVSILDKESIKKIIPLLDRAAENNQIGTQDYAFYIGIIEIRNKNYSKALEQRKQVKIPQYQPIIESFKTAIRSYNWSKAIPQYYQDWLVGLAALKNGYFTIARKIALETLLQDENYILPYQILSYSHFLTNNWDTAIEYFLKLSNFDKKNKEIYTFLVGVSYYRKWDFSSSILYLSQVKEAKFETDKLRYLIINYLEINEQNKVIEKRQRLLWQNDIKKSDFYLYFYETLYKSYFSQNRTLYENNKQLATLFGEECIKKLGENQDICSFWNIGLSIVEQELSEENEKKLEILAETYNQSYLYHILWDFNQKKNNIEKAKELYAKTISISQDKKEIEFVEKKLSLLSL